jgi:hypothetical protein
MKVQDFKDSWNFVFGERKFNGIDNHIILSIVKNFDEKEIANSFVGMLIEGYMKNDNVQPPLARLLHDLKSERGRKDG